MRFFFWKLFRKFLFRFEAETAHRITVRLVRLGMVLGGGPLRVLSGAQPPEKKAPIVVFGQEFGSRVGLAAGFDKNAEILLGLPSLGFGFGEIGTVTPRPQPGNPLPRLFRDPAQKAILNRMGFNNLGASAIAERLRGVREKLPRNFRVGVNLGKNKDTPLEKAVEDYVLAARAFEDLADYLVINVSSPNTAGLRSLQNVELLRPMVGEVNQLISRWSSRPPLLLKLAPEITSKELSEIIPALDREGIDGWILTNTLGGQIKISDRTWDGGWSGHPLKERSRQSLVEARKLTVKPIISVGGIDSAEEACERLALGADLVQIYTGWIYRGPALPGLISRHLESLEKQRPETQKPRA